MQEGFREGLLKILKGHRDLQRFTPKADRDNLKDFENNSESSENSSESFKNVLKEKIKFKTLSEDFNENQLEIKWV